MTTVINSRLSMTTCVLMSTFRLLCTQTLQTYVNKLYTPLHRLYAHTYILHVGHAHIYNFIHAHAFRGEVAD